MHIKKIVVGFLYTNCYAIINEKKEAIVIDPGAEGDEIISFLKPYKVVEILVTHHHPDHVGALKQLEQHYNLKENEHTSHFKYEVIKTPGHTSDSLSFYFPEIETVFTGDFIFKNTIGRMDFGGNEHDMKKSLQMFLDKFKNQLDLYPGHGETTTLEEERKLLQIIEKHLKL